jgi:hypothetical protein
VLPIVLIVFVIAVVAKNKEKAGEDMFKQLYVYLVLFATLMMSIGGAIGIFMGASDIISPSGYYQTYGDYKQSAQYDDNGKVIKISEKEMRKDYKQSIQDEKERTKEQGKSTIVKSLGFIVIPLPIFFIFNRMRKNKE